jgi:hypothetical protein
MSRKNNESREWFLNDALPAKTATTINAEAMDKAVKKVVRPGGDARGKQKIDAADKWRKPAVEFAEKIWREFPDLPVAVVGQRIRKLLPEDKQPSDRALKDHIRPLKPKK